MSGWTPERVAKAKRMWAHGVSPAIIAETLGGVTRNAVIGKADREQWPRGTTAAPSDDAYWRRANENGDAKLLRALALHQLRQQAC